MFYANIVTARGIARLVVRDWDDGEAKARALGGELGSLTRIRNRSPVTAKYRLMLSDALVAVPQA